MDAFRWDRHFKTGLEEVDSQHHQLVDLINEFGNILASNDAAISAKTEAVLRRLKSYAHYHFDAEEALMMSFGVDARYADRHKREHGHFLQEVSRMHAGLNAGNPNAASSLLRFLSSWLAYHILGSDHVLAHQIRDIQAGRSPTVAYSCAQRRRLAPTAPLLEALHGLFEQISERNRDLVELNLMLERKVQERTQALAEVNRQLESIASTDVLTGLPNRRHALASLDKIWERARQLRRPLSCLMIDADGFKQINDSLGHDAGDAVLRRLAVRLQDCVRTDDLVARLGGDEFLVLCPDTTLGGALTLGEALRSEVSEMKVAVVGGAWCGSISVGAATMEPDMPGPNDLIKAADRGVYEAKRLGRNAVASVQRESAWTALDTGDRRLSLQFAGDLLPRQS